MRALTGVETTAMAVFNKIDDNGGGQILFEEFIRWALHKNLDLDDDDDFVSSKRKLG